MVTTIEAGIYKHFKGKLYFVQCCARVREELTNIMKESVIYHLLYPDPIGWYGVSPKVFLENIERDNYSGPRFKKVMNRSVADILPGCIWIDPRLEIGKTGQETHLAIVEIVSDDSYIARVLMRNHENQIVCRTITDLILRCIFANHGR